MAPATRAVNIIGEDQSHGWVLCHCQQRRRQLSTTDETQAATHGHHGAQHTRGSQPALPSSSTSPQSWLQSFEHIPASCKKGAVPIALHCNALEVGCSYTVPSTLTPEQVREQNLVTMEKVKGMGKTAWRKTSSLQPSEQGRAQPLRSSSTSG